MDTDQTPALTDTAEVDILDEPRIQVVKSQTLTTDVNINGLPDVGDVVTYSYVVTNTGNVTLSNVTLNDDVEGTLTLSDGAGDGVDELAAGDSETASADHTVTQAEFDAGTLVNIATAAGEGPQGRPVQDTDTETVVFAENPAIAVLKTQELTTDANLNGLPDVGDVVTYSYTVTNTGDVTLSNVALVDDVEGTLTLSDVALDGIGVLAVGDSETATSDHTVTQAEFDAGPLTNIATADGESPLGTNVSDTDTQTVNFTQTPGISIDKTSALTTDADGDGVVSAGDTLTYSYLVTNDGDVTLNNVTVTDPHPGLSVIDCPATTLAVGADMTCTATYVVTQDDVDAGEIRNTGTADSDEAGPVTDEEIVPVPQNPAILIDKTSALTTDADGDGVVSAGDTLTYSYLVTNDGDVTLNNVTVTDPHPGLSVIDCPATTLAVGADMTCTATYVVTQDDVDAGEIRNTGTADSDEAGPVTDEEIVPVPQNPAILIDKTSALTTDADGDGVVSAGDTLTYSYLVTNTGDVTLNNVTVTDPHPGLSAIGCPATTLAVGANMTCTATYVVTQGDVDNGQIINTGTADSDETPPVSDEEIVPVPQNAAILIDKTSALTTDADGDGVVSAGDTLTYSYLVTNTGDVTLNNVTVTDPHPGLSAIGCPATTLAVGANMTCMATYVVTQGDVDNGQIINTGTADSDETPPVSDPEIVPVSQNPGIDVVKSQELTTDVNGDGQAAVGDVITYSYTVTNIGDVTLTDVALVDDVEGVLALSDVAGDGVAVLAVGDTETASAAHTLTQEEFDAGPVVPLPEIPGNLNAGDYVIFAQSRDGKAAETIGNGSNDAQASVSGSDNSLFGRIRSNADFSSSGQNIYYHYVGNGPTASVPPDTLNDGKITYRFLNDNGDNFYETPLTDPQFPTLTDGTWLPVQSDVPVGPVAEVPLGDPYQYWPGNLHTVVTAASNYLQMDAAALEPFCDFGSLTGGAVEFDLTGGRRGWDVLHEWRRAQAVRAGRGHGDQPEKFHLPGQ